MGCELAGKNAVLSSLLDGATLALGRATKDENGNMTAFTEISTSSSVNPNYSRLSIKVATSTPSSPAASTLYVSISGGTATSILAAAFKDADDGQTPDSLNEYYTGGWQEQVDSIGIYRGSTLYYAATFTDEPITVYQGHRIRIAAGNFQLTFSPSETAEAATALAMDGKFIVEE